MNLVIEKKWLWRGIIILVFIVTVVITVLPAIDTVKNKNPESKWISKNKSLAFAYHNYFDSYLSGQIEMLPLDSKIENSQELITFLIKNNLLANEYKIDPDKYTFGRIVEEKKDFYEVKIFVIYTGVEVGTPTAEYYEFISEFKKMANREKESNIIALKNKMDVIYCQNSIVIKKKRK